MASANALTVVSMVLDVIKTPLNGTAWSLELREPILADWDGPGYTVLLEAEYATREDMEESMLDIRSDYYADRFPLAHGDCSCC